MGLKQKDTKKADEVHQYQGISYMYQEILNLSPKSELQPAAMMLAGLLHYTKDQYREVYCAFDCCNSARR
eukprot:7117540-Ditylum_brightwellii.AAC.1